MTSSRPTSCLLALALFAQALLTGCQGLTTAPPAGGTPATPPTQNAQQCGPVVTPSFTQQYLYAGDIAETNNLWVYKIDAQTGVPQPMPWAPIKTTNNSHSGTGDPSGQFVYVGEDNPFSTTDRIIETYRLAPDDGAPTRVGLINSGYPAQLSFDPQGKILYLADPVGASEGSGTASTIEPYTFASDGMPLRAGTSGVVTPRYVSSYGLKTDANFVFAARTSQIGGDSQGSIAVFSEKCADGSLTKISELFAAKGLRFIAVPATGKTVIGYDCASKNANFSPNAPTNGAQLFRVDKSNGNLAPEPGGFYPGICRASVDRQSRFVAASLLNDPENSFSHSDILVIYSLDSDNVRLTETDRVTFPLSAVAQTRDVAQMAFDVEGTFLYVSLAGGGGLAAFRLDRATGKLTQLPGSPYPTPTLYSPLFVVGRK